MVSIVLFDVFLSRRLLLGNWGCRGCHRNLLCPFFFFNLESAVINGTVAVASSPFTVSAVTDHGLLHGFWWPHRPQMSSWSPAATCALDLDIYNFMCMNFLHVCIPAHCSCAWCLQKSVTICHVVLGTKLDFLQEQQVLWTIEPSLQPPKKAIFAYLHYTE